MSFICALFFEAINNPPALDLGVRTQHLPLGGRSISDVISTHKGEDDYCISISEKFNLSQHPSLTLWPKRLRMNSHDNNSCALALISH